MAKKREEENQDQLRQSRKDILIQRRQESQTRQVRLAIFVIVGFLALVLLIGIVNELIIKPDSAIAVVNDAEVTLSEWQDRVRFQRGQLVIGIEDLAEAFGQDIGQVQQFAGQQISLLESPESLGEFVLDQLVDEEIVRQAAEERGIQVSDSEVQKEIEESFGYFGGAVPTALPTATETVMPTPSLTPIVSEEISGDQPTAIPQPSPTAGPTSTPFPTSTPVSRESFQETLDETMAEFKDLGTDESIFEDVIRARLYEERLLDELALEEELPDEANQTSFFFVSFPTEEAAQQAEDDMAAGDFLTVWNTIKSQPPESAGELSPTIANEIIWRTQEEVASLFTTEFAETVFDQPIDEPSTIIVVPATADGAVSDGFYIIMVSGREMRPLSESALNSARQELLQSWLETQRQDGVEIYERWRANVPPRPVLDRRFLLPPTPAPATPVLEVPELGETPAPE